MCTGCPDVYCCAQVDQQGCSAEGDPTAARGGSALHGHQRRYALLRSVAYLSVIVRARMSLLPQHALTGRSCMPASTARVDWVLVYVCLHSTRRLGAHVCLLPQHASTGRSCMPAFTARVVDSTEGTEARQHRHFVVSASLLKGLKHANIVTLLFQRRC